MALPITPGHPTLIIRRSAYERVNLVRAALDTRLGLTPDEFRVDGGLVAIGPVYDEEALAALLTDLEALGLAYFDDFFEVPSSWPEWLRVYVGDGDPSGVQGAVSSPS